MLIRFRVSNFKSIRDEQEFSMVASSLAGPAEPVRAVDGLDVDLLTVAAIYGPNASGKSTILDAFGFILEATEESHRTWRPSGPIPRQPFLLSAETVAAPSSFEVEFLIRKVRYRYGFVLDAERVLEEWLYVFPNGRKQEWFVREADTPEPFRFGKHLSGENRTIQSLTRNNSLFLSAAAQNNHAQLLPVYEWFSTRIRFAGPNHRELGILLAQQMLEDSEKRAHILDILALADIGIVGAEVDRVTPKALLDEHYTGIAVPPRLRLRHRAAGTEDGVAISFTKESHGTQALLSLSVDIVNVLRSGGILFVDELDASLHPAIAREVVKMFHDQRTNPHGAQLIFNTHDTNLLNGGDDGARLRRDQIWFTEKDDAGATHLYSLTDFKPRAEENLERGYLQGRYGAIPVVGSLSFLHDTSPDDGEARE